MIGDFGGGTSQIRSGSELAGGARSFKKTTSTGGDNWPLNELARVQQEDLDRLGQHMAKWKQASVQPLQFILNLMSMIPKTEPGSVRMIAPMASG